MTDKRKKVNSHRLSIKSSGKNYTIVLCCYKSEDRFEAACHVQRESRALAIQIAGRS